MAVRDLLCGCLCLSVAQSFAHLRSSAAFGTTHAGFSLSALGFFMCACRPKAVVWRSGSPAVIHTYSCSVRIMISLPIRACVWRDVFLLAPLAPCGACRAEAVIRRRRVASATNSEFLVRPIFAFIVPLKRRQEWPGTITQF